MAAIADFAHKFGLVLRACNLSRGRLAQAVGIDKSVVSRWASGVQAPTDHNLTLLTEAVGRHRPGFARADWELSSRAFAARLGLGDGPSEGEPELALPGRPSIAVLPFTNMSGDLEQEYFADGMVEDIITALSRIPSFFVIAGNSTFSYKGTSPDMRQVGRELGVRYVLEGSVRKAGNRLRIAAQLIDAATGNHLWAERYDCEAIDIFTVQDEITANVVGSLEPQILLAEGGLTKRQKPTDLDAWGYVTRAYAHLIGGSRKEMQTALDLLERAIECDPQYARAHANLASLQVRMTYRGWLADRDQAFEAAAASARRAVELDPNDPWSHFANGQVASLTQQHDEALASLARAVELNPNFALAHSRLGSTRPVRAAE